MAFEEPARPQRGSTADERGSDRSVPEQQLDTAEPGFGRLGAAANPKFLLSQADGYPAGVKQFLQFCLILVYPAWLFFILIAYPLYGIWWLLGKTVGKVLFELWWLCTGWIWKKYGGFKPGSPEDLAKKAREAAEAGAKNASTAS